MKKMVVFALTLVWPLLLCSCAAQHYDENTIRELYDEEWIVGKTRATIEEKYGGFDREFVSDQGKDLGAFYVNYDTNLFDPSYIHDTYFIEFNEQDVAIDAFFAETSRGG